MVQRTITVTVSLYGYIRHHFKGSNTKDVEMPEKSVVKDIFPHISLPPDSVDIISLNGVKVSRDHHLHHGDNVAIYPMVAGG